MNEGLDACEGVEVEVDIARRLFRGSVLVGPAFDPKGNRIRVQ